MKLNAKKVLVLVLNILIIITSFIIISQINFRSARKEAYREIQNSGLPLTRKNIYSEIIKDLTPAINTSSYMANDFFLQNWIMNNEKNTGDLINYLDKIHTTYNYFSTFFISEKTGAYYHYSGILKHVSPNDEHDNWYYSFISGGKDYELDVDTNEAADNTLTIFINFRVKDASGNLLGVTGVGLKMEHFSELLEDIHKRYGRHVYLVDTKGIIQAHSDNKYIEKSSIHDLPGISEISTHLLSEYNEPVDLTYKINNKTSLVTGRYIPEIEWFLIVEQEGEQALVSAKRSFLRTSILGFIIAVLTIIFILVLQRAYQKNLETLAETDPLTGIANRRQMEERFNLAEYRLDRFGTCFSLVIIDIDDFKNINDQYGHNAGDLAIKRISLLIEKNIRTVDFLARMGGDEFIILYEGTAEQASVTAKRIMQQLETQFGQAIISAPAVTISCGITEFQKGETHDKAMKRADDLMYKAKKMGKNQVAVG